MTDKSPSENWLGSWYETTERKELTEIGCDLSSTENWMLAFDKFYFAKDKSIISYLTSIRHYKAKDILYAETQEFSKYGYNCNPGHNLLLKWWTYCVENKDLELCKHLLSVFPADATFRKDIWYGVYTFRYPITIVIENSWQEGFELLCSKKVRLGNYQAVSEKVVAHRKKPCEFFHDIERLADQNQVILTPKLRAKIKTATSGIDPLGFDTKKLCPPEEVVDKLRGLESHNKLKADSPPIATRTPKSRDSPANSPTVAESVEKDTPADYEWNLPSKTKAARGKLTPYDIIFKSMPRIGKRSPLLGIWPDCAERSRVSKPIIFNIDCGYLTEAGFGDDYSLPTTIREYEYDDLSQDEALEYFKDHCEGDGLTSDLEEEIGKPINKWTEVDVEFLEGYFSDYLDSEVDPDQFGRYTLALYSKHGLAIQVYDQIGPDLARKMNLFMVDGEYPGSDFIGVKYTGYDPAPLNHWLAKSGLNMIVIDSES
ncbi:hypothetical protein N8843_07760 [Verrucomicrobia bacterium]|nr:hypothetical protein [Verrucomicrobiota bacterium]